MSCFKLPKELIKDLEVLISKFWWAYNGENRKTHWEKWERLCEAKEVGGMRFKEIEKFNEALLAKQVWRMINNPNSLCHRVFKARFFPEYSILEAQDSITGSYAWKSIISARNVIRKGMVWHIGTRDAMRIQEDKRLPGQANRVVISPLSQVAVDSKVNVLIDQDRAVWKSELVQQLFFYPMKLKLSWVFL